MNVFWLGRSRALFKIVFTGLVMTCLIGLVAACGSAAPNTDQIAAQILATPTPLSIPTSSTDTKEKKATFIAAAPTEVAVIPVAASATVEPTVESVPQSPGEAVQSSSAGFALRFFGTGKDDLDRVKIPLDTPVNIGAEDFTLEWWLKANPGDNQSGACGLGNDNWITGNIIFDRDVWGNGDYGDYGMALAGGRIAFGVNNGISGDGICSTTDIADGRWHHLAVTRRLADGWLGIFVDGQLEAQLDGPDGNISYRLERTSDYEDDPFFVIGAEKHDAGAQYPSFNGWLDEIRISNMLRYTSNFVPPSAPFQPDANTKALWHLDEGAGTSLGDASPEGLSVGTLNVGGPNNGPQWVASDAPLSQTGQAASPAPATDSASALPPVAEAAPTENEAEAAAVTAGYALRFFGTGSDDIDRVKIPVDDPVTDDAGPPADVGFTDFTLEAWLRAEQTENPAPAVECGPDNVNWINGNIIFDRDRHSQGRKYGVSLAGGRLVFGVSGDEGAGDYTLCGTSTVTNGKWHHIAVQRRRTDGGLWLFVDGQLEAEGTGPAGDISYPDDGQPGDFCEGPCTNSDPFLVIGAEKHDAGAAYPSFSGWLDEVRLSNTLRYNDNFTPPTVPFEADANTVALWHFDEGSGTTVGDAAPGGLSAGTLMVGGPNNGPQWVVSDAPLDRLLANPEEAASNLEGAIVQTTVTDFQDCAPVKNVTIPGGILTDVTITPGADGEIRLQALLEDYFEVDQVNPDLWFVTNNPGYGNYPLVDSGVITHLNSGIRSQMTFDQPRVAVEARVRFGDPKTGFADLGFGKPDKVAGPPNWLFITTNESPFPIANAYHPNNFPNGPQRQVINDVPTADYHNYRIVVEDWTRADYFVDGMLRDTKIYTTPVFTQPAYVWLYTDFFERREIYADWIRVAYYEKPNGKYLSCVQDAGQIVPWETFSWDATVPETTSVSFSTRTSADGATWSDWSESLTSSGSTITSPAGRYLQYVAELSTSDVVESPEIQAVAIDYSSP